jgi:hypothetical protein
LIAKHAGEALSALASRGVSVGEGCRPVIEKNSAERAGLGDRWPVVAREEIGRETDVVIAFGGDGTLLDAASAVAHSEYDAPLLGINLGRLGFLTDVGRADMLEALGRLVGSARPRTRGSFSRGVMRAAASSRTPGPERHRRHQGALARMIGSTWWTVVRMHVKLMADRRDGTGSTALLSAGGRSCSHPLMLSWSLRWRRTHSRTAPSCSLPRRASSSDQRSSPTRILS